MECDGELVELQGGLVPRSWVAAIQMIVQNLDPRPVVVLRGEAGTGKDLVARLLHAAAGRAPHSFVKVRCALPPDRLAVQLFGHERDGGEKSRRRRLGAVQFAHRGTLYLDHVEALPASLHAAVLPLLLGQPVRRAGGPIPIAPDVAVVLSTSAPCLATPREDVWRAEPTLRVLDMELPPLRARRQHVESLAEFFLRRFNDWYDRAVSLSAKTRAWLRDYDWPGNVAELESVVRGLVTADDPAEGPRHGGRPLESPPSSVIRRSA